MANFVEKTKALLARLWNKKALDSYRSVIFGFVKAYLVALPKSAQSDVLAAIDIYTSALLNKALVMCNCPAWADEYIVNFLTGQENLVIDDIWKKLT